MGYFRTSGACLSHPQTPLLGTQAARRGAGALLGGCLGLVGLLGFLLARQSAADGFDRAMDGPVISWLGGRHGLLGLHGLLGWLAFPGTPIPAAAVTLVLVAACLRARRLNGAILALLAVPVSTGIDEELLKPLVHRTYLGALAFPSGHTTTAMTLTATMAVLYVVGVDDGVGPARGCVPGSRVRGSGVLGARTRVRGVAAVTVGLAVTCVVALAVIALRWHYFTDTVAGAAVGVGTVCALALLLDSIPWM